MTSPLIFDSHLDLAWNAIGWNLDLEQTVHEICCHWASSSADHACRLNLLLHPILRDAHGKQASPPAPREDSRAMQRSER